MLIIYVTIWLNVAKFYYGKKSQDMEPQISPSFWFSLLQATLQLEYS